MPNGIRYELRRPREVFDSAAMESFAQVPVTHGHPSVGMLTVDNAKQYMVGATGERVTRDDNHVATSLMIAERPTIDAVEGGDVEVSAGYACHIEQTPGVAPEYASASNPTGRYDVEQTNIRGNHLAVAVGRGRAGRTARMRMDAELTAEERNNLKGSQFAVPSTSQLPIHDAEHTRGAMARFNQTDFPDMAAKKAAYGHIVSAAKKFGIDSTGFESKFGGRADAAGNNHGGGAMDPEKLAEQNRILAKDLETANAKATSLETELNKVRSDAQDASGQIKQLTKKNEELAAKVAGNQAVLETDAIKTLKARADKAETAVARYDAERNDWVRARCTLVSAANAHMGAGFRTDDLSDRQIMAAVVARLDTSADIGANVSDAEIGGMFKVLTKSSAANALAMAHASSVIASGDIKKPRVDAREEGIQEARNAWRKPLSNDPRAHAAGGK